MRVWTVYSSLRRELYDFLCQVHFSLLYAYVRGVNRVRINHEENLYNKKIEGEIWSEKNRNRLLRDVALQKDVLGIVICDGFSLGRQRDSRKKRLLSIRRLHISLVYGKGWHDSHLKFLRHHFYVYASSLSP
jgi:hypothetical protein